MFVKVTSDCLFAKLTSARPPLQPEFNFSTNEHIQILLLAKFPRSLLSKEQPKVTWIFGPKMAKNRSCDGITNHPGTCFIHVFEYYKSAKAQNALKNHNLSGRLIVVLS